MTTLDLHRRRWLGVAAASSASLLLPPVFAADQDKRQLRIGYQKYGTLTLLKARGTLETRLARDNIDVRWIEFPAGPQLLEGLNVRSIDFGTVGEAPPIFAQAARADLVYVANQPPSPDGEAIVVHADSPIRTVADLKGRRVALNKGSNVHYLLVRALEQAKLQYADVQTVFLPPADARAAFERGAVDAWVIWDPFLAAAQKQLNARVLTTGEGLVANHQFFVAARAYAQREPQLIAAIIDELAQLDHWAQTRPAEVARFLAPQIGLREDIAELAVRRYAYGIRRTDDATIAQQQKIADAFHALRLIPKPITVADALWRPAQVAASKP